MSGYAHCDVCDRTWPDSKWTLIDDVVFYWCPVCHAQLEMFPEDVSETDSSRLANKSWGLELSP